MEKVIEAKYRVVYNGKNITADLAGTLVSLTYTDHSEGSSDELQLTVEDSLGLWRYPWIPAKGDKLEAFIGDGDVMVPCGRFEVDEMNFTGPPDSLEIRALAVPVTSSMRTRRSYAHENKTLAEIARSIAKDNGLTVQGKIRGNLRLERTMQHQETDLAFLRRVSMKFGYVFSIRDDKLIFTSIYDLESASSVASIDRSGLTRYDLKDTAHNVYRAAKVKYHEPNTNELVEAGHDDETGLETSGSVLTIYERAENFQQAEEMGRAALHRANTRAQEGTLVFPGNPLILAGVNIELTGMGRLSGIYHVKKSVHSLTPSGAYTTDVEVKKVALINESKW